MGKKKQQKLHQIQSKKQKKEEMKGVLAKLAQSKHKNKSIIGALTPITRINEKKRIIQKQMKKLKLKPEKRDQDLNQSAEQIAQHPDCQKDFQQIEKIDKPQAINIFGLNEYNSGRRTVINNPAEGPNALSKMDQQKQQDLQSRAKKALGTSLNFDRFGDKPLRIKEQEEDVVLSQDQNEPNSIKNISHKGIPIPEGRELLSRSKQIEEFRKGLPIYMKQQQIVETINNNLVTLICGQTGSGKSTQLVQFLYEKNYVQFGKIAVTQPRRLATISLASRVAQQMNYKLGEEVGYQVRHQRRQNTQKGSIKFMTDGILLNQMSSDFLLSQYGVIVIDEAHERKINTDILIGLLSRLILIRYKMSVEGQGHPLRLVIMSATMRVSDFQNERLFGFHVPIVNVEARMFPVTVFHEKNTPEDYIETSVNKCMKIHKRLPEGDVLIFLTGKEQIHKMAIMLEQALERQSYEEMDIEDDQEQLQMPDQPTDPRKPSQDQTKNERIRVDKFLIHCLYSSLPLEQQEKIFLRQPPGTRKFIISTNIAETSITIPNIRYVIDSGQQKHKYFDGVWRWRKGWGSRAMAQQRAGRAGRTAHGYCYRLYSPALFANIMEEHPPPQITKIPLDNVILQIKTIGIKNVFGFPFPTPPENDKMFRSLEGLIEIGALQGKLNEKESRQTTQVTELGKILSFIPVDPKLGKMLLVGRKRQVEKFVLICVVLLTVQGIFLEEFNGGANTSMDDDNLKAHLLEQKRQKTKEFKQRYAAFNKNTEKSDFLLSMNIVGEFFTRLFSQKSDTAGIQKRIKSECGTLSLNPNTMRQLYYNTDQLCEIYETLMDHPIDLASYKFPTAQEVSSILEILLCSYISNLCRLEKKNHYKTKGHEDVYVSHLSTLYMKDQLFVCCVEVYSNSKGRKYMRYPFSIQNYQLLAQFGQIKEIQNYIWKNKQIMGKSSAVVFGWQVPGILIDQITTDNKYYHVAKMFLEGVILAPLKAVQKFLNAPINSIKPDNLSLKVQKLVSVFRKHHIDNEEKLLNCFRSQKQFMKEELKMWLSVNNYDQFYAKLRGSIVA